MESGNVKSITIRIAGRSYPVKVQDIDHQDALTMTLLTYAFDLYKNKQQEDTKVLIHNKLDVLDKMIESAV